MSAPAIDRTVTEYAAVFTHSGNIWMVYATREAAQVFAAAAPAPMHVMSREVTGDTHTRWVRA